LVSKVAGDLPPGMLAKSAAMSDLGAATPSGAHATAPQNTQGEVKVCEVRTAKKAFVVANKVDLGVEPESMALLQEYLGGDMKVVTFSALTGEGTDTFKLQIFDMLSLVRVYTKVPGRKPDLERPFVLPVGSTILAVANLVHKDFASNLRFARIWGTGVFDGQFVERDHVVKDKDVVELHL